MNVDCNTLSQAIACFMSSKTHKGAIIWKSQQRDQTEVMSFHCPALQLNETEPPLMHMFAHQLRSPEYD
jgi:hypothetical protein